MKEALDLINGYPAWVKVAVLVLLAAIVVLLVFFRTPASQNVASSFSEADRKKLVASLHEYLTSGSHSAQIEFSSMKEQETAKLIKSCFDSAGWTTELNNVPLETGLQAAVVGYIVGVKVKSVNSHLSTSIAREFTDAGLYRVTSETISTAVQPDNPKWLFINRRVQITVGHRE